MGQALIHVVAGVLSDTQGRVLIARRPAQSHQGGLWEFPGGKLEPGESPADGLRRELHEELGIQVLACRPLIQVEHDYGDRCILLDVHRVLSYQGQPQGCEGQPLAWRSPEALEPDDFPPADKPVISALRLPPLCLITPEHAPDPMDSAQERQTADFLALLDGALKASSMSDSIMVQLRAHGLSDRGFIALAREVSQLCRERKALLVLNREPASMPDFPAHGFHLTASRLHGISPMRDRVGLLGASCHNAADLARAAELKLDYAFLSPVQATRSHPQARPLGWMEFARLVRSAHLPVYALGGLTPDDLPEAWAQGAQGIAAMRGLVRA